MRRHAGEKRQEKAKAAWGASLSSPSDIAEVFVKYASGTCMAAVPCSWQSATTGFDGSGVQGLISIVVNIGSMLHPSLVELCVYAVSALNKSLAGYMLWRMVNTN